MTDADAISGQSLQRSVTPYRELIFDGDRLLAVVLESDGTVIPIRMLCEPLGLDTVSQLERIREHEVLSRGVRLVRIPVDGQLRSVAALLTKYVPFWLATIRPGDVNEEMRPKLVRYQTDLVEVLAQLYGPAQTVTTAVRPIDPDAQALQQRVDAALAEFHAWRETQREHAAAQDSRLDQLDDIVADLQNRVYERITAAQQVNISKALKRIAVRYQIKYGKDLFGKLFGEFTAHFQIPRYALLPADRYDEAMQWIAERGRALLPGDDEAVPPVQGSLL